MRLTVNLTKINHDDDGDGDGDDDVAYDDDGDGVGDDYDADDAESTASQNCAGTEIQWDGPLL